MRIQTADFGEFEVIETGMKDWYQYLVHPKEPRIKELWAASVELAGPHKTMSYPFRFNEHEINYAGGKKPMTTPNTITIDMVVEAYVKTRSEIEEKKRAYEEEEARLKAIQSKREDWLAWQMTATGQVSASTPHGTCYFTTKESATVGDWDTLLGYIIETDQFNLLERRVAKTAVLEIMGDKRENPPPPGVNYVAIRGVNVRKK